MSVERGKVLPVDLEQEMRRSYIDYAMSVIVGRALPDVRDGLKPVHRRVLYAMYEAGMGPDKPFKKSARVVGDVLARYHPHGDVAVYDSLVRLAQDFNSRYPLVEGHGNFGSIDGDSPAAMRYTEARLAPLAMEMLADIDKDTVDFVPNYDDSTQEPTVMPARVPNLLINGSSGIAVGMATNIPPHNLGEVVAALVQRIDRPDGNLDDVLQVFHGPDFPTAGLIIGEDSLREVYRTGRGAITMRARVSIEPLGGDRHRLVVTELPYQVNKAALVERIARLVQERKIEGITDLRDESDRQGLRIVIDLRRGVDPRPLLNQLYRHTQLQDTFGAIMLALVKGRPRLLSLLEMLDLYLEHRKEVVTRRTSYLLHKAEERIHIVAGLRQALDQLDAVIATIRAAATVDEARQNLMANFGFSEKQAQAILDMRLQRLTGLERQKLDAEHTELQQQITYYRQVLDNPDLVAGLIKEELLEVKKKYADARRTQILPAEGNFEPQDLVADTPTVVILTRRGYIKRLPVDTYRSQKRGGRGMLGITTREKDFVQEFLVTTTHHWLLFFTDKGKAYRLRAYDVPEEGRQARGLPLINLIPLGGDERVTAVLATREFTEGQFLVMTTARGVVKRTSLTEFDTARRDGLIAVGLEDGDWLVGARLTDGRREIVLGTRRGIVIRFPETDVRQMGRTARGVRGITLGEGDVVINLATPDPEEALLVISTRGYGKRTSLAEYRLQSRGGRGLKLFHITKRTGQLADIKAARPEDELWLMSSKGIMIRLDVSDIPLQGRVTQGVILKRLEEDEEIVAVALAPGNHS